jgi:hypothetical protein
MDNILMFHARPLFFGEHAKLPEKQISENEATLGSRRLSEPQLQVQIILFRPFGSAQFGADSRRFLYLQGPWGEKNTAAKLIIRCGS